MMKGEDEYKGGPGTFRAAAFYNNRFLKRTPRPVHSWQDSPDAGAHLNALVLYPPTEEKANAFSRLFLIQPPCGAAS
jgi:hypothetical protein